MREGWIVSTAHLKPKDLGLSYMTHRKLDGWTYEKYVLNIDFGLHSGNQRWQWKIQAAISSYSSGFPVISPLFYCFPLVFPANHVWWPAWLPTFQELPLLKNIFSDDGWTWPGTVLAKQIRDGREFSRSFLSRNPDWCGFHHGKWHVRYHLVNLI